jgi:hypothetical protein
MNTQHTPTPWRRQPRHNSLIIAGPSGEQIALVRALTSDCPQGQANLAFIVRACNSHAQLVEALRDALPALEQAVTVADISAGYSHDERQDAHRRLSQARAALSAAKQ